MAYWMLLIVGLLIGCHHWPTAEAKLNLFLSQREVRRLLGLSAELYYVREGVINEYALNFVVPVQANIQDLYFTWQALGDTPLPYSLDVNVSKAMTPYFNISSVGIVPTKMQTFRLSLPCSGLASMEVDVVFSINVTLSKTAQDVTPLVFRRRKICLQETNPYVASDPEVVKEDVTQQQHSLETNSTSVAMGFYIAIGCACGFVAALVTLTVALYIRNWKCRQPDYAHGANDDAVRDNHPATAFLQRMETPNSNTDFHATGSTSSKSHSSCISFRPTPVYGAPVMSLIAHQQPNTFKTDQLATQSLRSASSASEGAAHAKDVRERIQELLVDRSRVQLQGVAQEGTFGRLFYAIYVNDQGENRESYVKTVKDQASSMQLSMMLQEGLSFHGMGHPNINSIVALCHSETGPPLLVYPFDGYSNLKMFLQQYRSSTKTTVTLTTQGIVDMALQTIVALQYIHDKKLLHKDIATRNCLVNDQLQIKLCDTALSRDIFPMDYHCLGDNENRPIKWMALESIAHKEYSSASDVWMFGVMLWELTTLAQQPYLEVDPFEMAAYLRDGYRLAQPLNCPDELFAVMAYCWAMSVDDRPSLSQLNAYLHDFFTHLNLYV